MSNHDLLTAIRDSLQEMASTLPLAAQDPRALRATAYSLQALAESVHAIADALTTEGEPRRVTWTEANPLLHIGSRVRCLCTPGKGSVGIVIRVVPKRPAQPCRDTPVVAWIPPGETPDATHIFPEGEGTVWERIS